MSEASIKGPIILWINFGYEGWAPYSFETVEAALKAEKYDCPWTITKAVQYEITETKELT